MSTTGSLVEKLRDAANQAGHYGAWSGGVLMEQAVGEIELLRSGLDDMLWRLRDIREGLLHRSFRDTATYGLDEWSTPIVNMDIAIKKLEGLKAQLALDQRSKE